MNFSRGGDPNVIIIIIIIIYYYYYLLLLLLLLLTNLYTGFFYSHNIFTLGTYITEVLLSITDSDSIPFFICFNYELFYYMYCYHRSPVKYIL